MKITANAIWLVGGKIASDALSFALLVVLAREFGPAGVGVYSFNFAIATVLYELASLGVDEYGVREYVRLSAELRRDLIATLVGAQLVIAAVAVVVVAVAGAAGAVDGAHAPLLAFMIVFQIAAAVANTFLIAPFASGQVGRVVAAEVAARAAILGIAIALIATDTRSLTEVLVGFPLAGLALMAVAALLAYRLGSSVVPRISAEATRRMLHTLWSFATANLLLAVFSRTGVVLVFWLAGAAAAGVFASAYKFAEVGWVMLTMLPYAAYPHMSALFVRDTERFRSVSLEVLRATLLFAALIAWGMYFVLPHVVVVLLGERFEAAQDTLRSFAPLVLVLGPHAHLSRMLLVADLQIARVRNTVVLVVLAVLLGVTLIPSFGVHGAVAALTLAMLVATALDAHALRRAPGFMATLRTLGVFVLCIAAAAAVARGASFYALSSWAAAMLSLAALVLAARAGQLFSARRWAAALR